MARKYGPVQCQIWNDPTWHKLSHNAQWLYLYVATTQTATLAGVADWRPHRIAKCVADVTPQQLIEYASELTAFGIAAVDEATEEIVIASAVDWALGKNSPRTQAGIVNAFSEIVSQKVRDYAAVQIRRVLPDLVLPDVEQLKPLTALFTAVDNLPEPVDNSPKHNPSITHASPIDGLSTTPHDQNDNASEGLSMAYLSPSDPIGKEEKDKLENVKGYIYAPVNAENATLAVASQRDSDAAAPSKKLSRGARIPDDFQPRQEDLDAMRGECPQVDLDAETRIFRDYWVAVPGAKGVKKNWHATWRNWIRRAAQRQGQRGGPRTPAADDWAAAFAKAQQYDQAQQAEHGQNRAETGPGATNSPNPIVSYPQAAIGR